MARSLSGPCPPLPACPPVDPDDNRRWAIVDEKTGRVVQFGLETHLVSIWLGSVAHLLGVVQYRAVPITMTVDGVAIPDRGPFHLPGGDQC